MVKYTNKIQTLLRECLLAAMAEWFGVGEDDCPVLMTGQPIPQTAKRCITYSKVGSTRVGFQGKRLVEGTDGALGVEENWVEELTFQINVRTKETTDDTENTPVARDIVEGLVSWMNAWRGLKTMREKGLFALRTSNTRDMLSTDESDLFQNAASFDFVFQVGQSKVLKEEAQEAVFLGTERV